MCVHQDISVKRRQRDSTHTYNIGNERIRSIQRLQQRLYWPQCMHTWVTGILRAKSLIKSLAFKIIYGSDVFRLVRTVILPSIKFNSHTTLYLSNAFVTIGHTSRKYFSRYFGNNVANELSSNMPVLLSSSFHA